MRVFREAGRNGYKIVAEDIEASDAEDVFERLQNFDLPWPSMIFDGKLHVARERSMSIGDLIVWEDGMIDQTDSFGFKRLAHSSTIGCRLSRIPGAA